MLPDAERALLPADTDVIHAVEQPIQIGPRQMTFDEYLDERVDCHRATATSDRHDH